MALNLVLSDTSPFSLGKDFRCINNVCHPMNAATLEAFKGLQRAINDGLDLVNSTLRNGLSDPSPVAIDGDIGPVTLAKFRTVADALVILESNKPADPDQMPSTSMQLAENARDILNSMVVTIRNVRGMTPAQALPNLAPSAGAAAATGGMQQTVPTVVTKTKSWGPIAMGGVVIGAGLLAWLLYRSLSRRSNVHSG